MKFKSTIFKALISLLLIPATSFAGNYLYQNGSIGANTLLKTANNANTGQMIATPLAIDSSGNVTGVNSLSVAGNLTVTNQITAAGNINSTNGSTVSLNGPVITSATGGIYNAAIPAVSGASPITLNGRMGAATFTGVSIAAGATQTFVITNAQITSATTQVLYGAIQGATAGSALSIDSVTNANGSSTVVIGNGTGATTDTANLKLVFLVLN